MELDEAIKGRRSIRSYKPEDVPDTIVEKLIEAATYAPSAGNIQPWRFVIARNAAAKKELAEAANQTWIKEAPVVIVVCANEKRAEMGLRW
jgi:nitroreductase